MNATTPDKPRSNAFHLQLPQEMDESVLESMLRKADIPLRTLRTVTPLHEGIAFTHMLAQGEWDQSTGAAACNGRCQDQTPRHVPYRDLSLLQREEFHSDYARGLDYYRSSLYTIGDGAFREMNEVAMSPCDEDSSKPCQAPVG